MNLKRCIYIILVLFLTFYLVFGRFIFVSTSFINNSFSLDFKDNKAYADDITLDSANAKLDTVSNEYDQIMREATSTQEEMDKVTAQAFQAQSVMLEKQESLRQLAVYEYKNSLSFSLASLILQSDSFDELIKNMDYANNVMTYQYTLAKEQEFRKNSFEAILADLNAKSAEYNKQLESAQNKISEAQFVVAEAAKSLNADEIEQLQTTANHIGGGGSTDTIPTPSPEPDPTPTPSPTPDPGPSPEPQPEPTPSWNYGVASAYGGSSDPSTPNPGITATGEICDDWSMGVAVPMAWPNYRQYFHHVVQIRYNGMTVIAKINDCGYMGGGSRSLDLQPGVFKAFGFYTCQAWGLRNIEYNIL